MMYQSAKRPQVEELWYRPPGASASSTSISDSLAITGSSLNGDGLFPKKAYRRNCFWEEISGDQREGGTVDESGYAAGDDDANWKYWERIYIDPKLSTQLSLSDSPSTKQSMTKLLSSEKFVKAELIFDNVPFLGRHAQRDVRYLLESMCGKNITLSDVKVSGKKWRARFGRCEDALKVQQRFQGFRFKGHVLNVEYVEPNYSDSPADEKTVIVEQQEAPKRQQVILIPEEEGKQKEEEKSSKDFTWGKQEMMCFENFRGRLAVALKMVPLERLDVGSTLLPDGSAAVIQDALTIWPTGLFRFTTNEARSLRDSWEPYSPFVIESDRELVEYVRELLLKFGPQNSVVDLPWRLFASTLSQCHRWPRDATALMRALTKLSVWFVMFKKTLFLASNETHMRSLAAKIRECA